VLAPVALLSGFSLADAGGTIASANVAFTDGKQAGDALTFQADTLLGTNISASFGADGSLVFSGSDTVAHYQQLLQTLQYATSSADPGAGLRSFGLSVTDGSGISANTSFDLNIDTSGLPPVTPFGGGQYVDIDTALSHTGVFTAENGQQSVSLTAQSFDTLHQGITMLDGQGHDQLALNITDVFQPGDIFSVVGDAGDTLDITGAELVMSHTEMHHGNSYNVYDTSKGVTLVIGSDVTVHVDTVSS
jgi:hypothetical protein